LGLAGFANRGGAIRMAILTLFTAPKPFSDPHINIIQRNTLKNWLALGEDIQIVVIGDEPGISETCLEFGVIHLPNVECNSQGTPLISSIFNLARQITQSPYLAYSNADILFLPGLMDVVRQLGETKDRFLGVGQRWDLDVRDEMNFSGDWASNLQDFVLTQGKLHSQTGSDYFIYPRTCFKDIPKFAVGRAGWDNWMLYWARRQNWALVDLTPALTVIHQNHDYRHLPGGQSHYRLPETADNIKLAGGRRTIFDLKDTVYRFDGKKIKRQPLTWQKFWREIEIFPLITLKSKFFGWISFAIFHPVKAFREMKRWYVSTIKRRSIKN
jgi:hypothetical protein